MISCTNSEYRRAYGWQRDGGMAEYLLAEEKDLILLPDQLTYLDGALVLGAEPEIIGESTHRLSGLLPDEIALLGLLRMRKK